MLDRDNGDILLGNKYKIVMPLFAVPNKHNNLLMI